MWAAECRGLTTRFFSPDIRYLSAIPLARFLGTPNRLSSLQTHRQTQGASCPGLEFVPLCASSSLAILCILISFLLLQFYDDNRIVANILTSVKSGSALC